MGWKRTKRILEAPVKFVYGKLISLEVKVVDRFVPDRLLLFYLNTLDKRIPPKAINGIIDGLDKLPPKVRSSLITAADEYVPDTVASSRKVSAVISAVYKYVPDRIIPPESTEHWSNIKMKFHIPTLLSRKDRDKPRRV
ncbi:MAG: hypothetical protein E3J81_03775 [Dehalococcoidia bacterium]|nr:MAG: hypothetical protein E3J81_03775 [Dehalococcoidia bacterium]